MKKFVLSVICALVSVSAFGQGTIALSNIGKTAINVNGAAAPAGTLVAFATADNNVIAGSEGTVLGAGFFSAGTKTLAGLTGNVSLKLAGSIAGSGVWSYSDAFSVTLGGAGTPPSPAAAMPNGVALNITSGPVVPEPSTIALAVLGGAALMFRRRK
jgi:hypothetical protein